MLQAKSVLGSQCPSSCHLESHMSSSTLDTGRLLLQVLAQPCSPCSRGCMRSTLRTATRPQQSPGQLWLGLDRKMGLFQHCFPSANSYHIQDQCCSSHIWTLLSEHSCSIQLCLS